MDPRELVRKLIAENVRRNPPLPPTWKRRPLREAMDLRQKDLAILCDTTESSISSWESGRREPTGEGGRRYRRLLDSIIRGLEGAASKEPEEPVCPDCSDSGHVSVDNGITELPCTTCSTPRLPFTSPPSPEGSQ